MTVKTEHLCGYWVGGKYQCPAQVSLISCEIDHAWMLVFEIDPEWMPVYLGRRTADQHLLSPVGMEIDLISMKSHPSDQALANG